MIHLKFSKLTAAQNMSEDFRLLEQAEITGSSFFRCYSWLKPAVTLGRFQNIEDSVDLEFCKINNIETVKRPTGGKAIFHDNDFTFAVVVSFPNNTVFPLKNSYTLVNAAAAAALKKIGCSVELNKNAESKNIIKDPVCFNYSYSHEIVAADKKIVGTAQRRLKKAALIQGNIHLKINYELYAGIFKTDASFIKSKFCALNNLIDIDRIDFTEFENIFYDELLKLIESYQ